MRITMFITSLAGGGAERVVCNLANYLVEQGHDIKILTIFDTEAAYKLDERVCVVALKTTSGSKIKKIRNMLCNTKKYFREERDCFLVLLEHPTIITLLFRKWIKVPIIISERNYPGTYPLLIRILLKNLSSRANAYVFQTNEAKIWYQNRLKNKKIKQIPNAVNEEFINIIPFSGERRKNIVSVGRLTEVKNHELLIRAFAQIIDEFSGYTLTIYGQGPLKEKLYMIAEELGVRDKVFLPGFSTKVRDEIKDAKLFVLPSMNEGIPNALIEAMALGLPCISTDFIGGGAKVLIEHGVNGLLVPMDNVGALAKALRGILIDSVVANNLSKEATKVVKRFHPQKIYKEWENFILEVIENKSISEEEK